MANEAKSDAPLPEGKGNPASGMPIAAPRLPAWWGIAVVLALTFAVYIPTLRYQFVHDDRVQIVENHTIRSWRSVPSYFTAHVWAGVMPDVILNYYRPLWVLWLRINEAVFGNQAWGWHLTAILVHVLATLLVYLLAWRLGAGREVALLAALIFGLHPAHIEAVAWISGVNEPLMGIFLLASLLAYAQSRMEGARARPWKVISLILFACALLMKENALILPGLLIVYEWMFGAEWGKQRKGIDPSPGIVPRPPSPQGGGLGFFARMLAPRQGILAWWGEALGRIWPYFLLVALYVPARIHALKGFSHVATPLSAAQLVFTWPALLAFWLRHLIWPAGLSWYYNFPAILHPTLTNFTLPAIFDIAVGVGVYAAVRSSRLAAFSAVWLVLPLVPLLNLRVFLANDFAHDRHLYLPSVGLAVLLAMLLKKVCGGPPRWLGIPTSLLAVILCLAAGMSYGTVTESFYFKDNLTFYAYNLTKAPHNPYAESNLASLLAERGQYGPALEDFLDVVNHNPDFWNATFNLALTCYKMGKMPEAERYFLQAIRVDPQKPDDYFYLGMTYFKSGRTEAAVVCLRRAIAIRPDGFAYHLALGMMLKTQGDLAGALQEFNEELANNPGEQAAAAQVKEIKSQLQANPAPGRP
jgi:hypothetical protein